MKLTKKKRKEIQKYLENNPIKINWEYKDCLSKEQIQKIISSEGGLYDLEDELFEMNLDFLFELEDYLCKNAIEEFELNIEPDEFREEFMDYIHSDINIKGLLNNTPDITIFAKVHSNYDCAISTQQIEDTEEYLGSVYKRVKKAVTKKEYLNEFYNSYTASIFCFVFKMPIEEYLELKNSFNKSITLPENTQYGFFSSFNGSGSTFGARTIKPITLPKIDATEYDCVDLIADIEQSYTMADVYGDTSFIDNDKGVKTK
jgi:hypothetical protein